MPTVDVTDNVFKQWGTKKLRESFSRQTGLTPHPIISEHCDEQRGESIQAEMVTATARRLSLSNWRVCLPPFPPSSIETGVSMSRRGRIPAQKHAADKRTGEDRNEIAGIHGHDG
ncbi:hypothetical protein Q7P37_004334 [Cladosporium fusiforme]